MIEPAIRCPLCGEPRGRELARVGDVEYCTSAREYVYRECGACRLVYLPDPPADCLDVIYPQNYYSHDAAGGFGWLQGAKSLLDLRLFRKALQAIPGSRLTILDVGGGTGWIASAIRRSDPRIAHSVIVDLNASLSPAAQRAGHEFVAARIEDYVAAQRFALITLLNLIEHVPDPRAVLASLKRCLAPEGRLVVKTPNTDTWDRRLFEATYWGGYHAPRHFRLFDRQNFERLASECGYSVETFRYTQGAPQWVASVLAWLERRGWIRISAQRPMWDHPLARPCLVAAALVDFARLPFAPTAQMFFVLRHAERSDGSR